MSGRWACMCQTGQKVFQHDNSVSLFQWSGGLSRFTSHIILKPFLSIRPYLSAMSPISCVIFSMRAFCSTTFLPECMSIGVNFFVGYDKKDYGQSSKEYFLSKSTRSFVGLFLQTHTGISNPFTVSVHYLQKILHSVSTLSIASSVSPAIL